ncbi:MAG TPA: SGNH/GDSL hydrolase family protein [Humidesulfovibrio sp.]|uniref:SGNH/GDSL hydrolase family protein n=1 Tax=Humidesulfovibrio sp. TaxID=2910988 RepID=UPI002C5B6B8F|nr:SGNH/GDSL hydrolase family protein [Humidesulfovibrio sp.]HWR04252.1 SGNH/GDSL hydrolase family protein [Humidesulfovibrio sp.]
MMKYRNIFFSTAAIIFSVLFALAVSEMILRVKNSTMRNYDIEMWRYAKELKKLDTDSALAFDHVPNKVAILQGVEIRTNEKGLRGGPVPPPGGDERRILFLGASITLGWGVAEQDTTCEQVGSMFKSIGENVVVFNGGVGNYNTVRYVSKFFKKLTSLKPTDIVVQYFLRDAENLGQDNGNIILRHSMLAVVLWVASQQLHGSNGETSLLDHYQAVYTDTAPGFVVMQDMLRMLAEYSKQNNIRIYLAMTPDIHNLVDYKFNFVHQKMETIAKRLGYVYIDLLPALKGIPPEQIYAMRGDPHPNALGHKIMAETIFATLRTAAH